MRDEDKAKDQVMRELAELRQRVAELKESEAKLLLAKEALRRSEQQYKRIFDNSPEVIGVLDTSGNLIDVNRTLLDWVGYKPEEVIGKNFRELPFLPAESLAIAMEKLTQVVRGEHIPPYELSFTTKRGERRIGRILTNPIRDEGKQLVGLLVMASDITERKRAEEALREREEKYKTLTDNINVGVYRNTPGPIGKFIEANPAIIKMFGYKNREEFLAIDVADLYQNPADRKKFSEKMSSQGFVQNEELQLKRKDSTPFFGAVSAVAIRDEKGEVKYHDGIVEDITERKKAEQKLKASHDKLQKILDGTVGALGSTTEKRDPYTTGHQRRVTQLASAIAKEMGLSEKTIQGIKVAGIVHDVGKIHIAAEILNRPRKLSEIEMDLVQSHCKAGYEILKTIEFPWPVAEILLQHHERMDGSGYPLGLSGEAIHIEARILAVADVIEAMISPRSYRSAFTIDEALEEIAHNRGTLYDAEVVDACLRLFDKGFRLDDDEKGG